MVAVREVIEPDENAAAYREPYRLFCDLDRRLGDYFRRGYGPGNPGISKKRRQRSKGKVQ